MVECVFALVDGVQVEIFERREVHSALGSTTVFLHDQAYVSRKKLGR
jgi:hypothetical protein